MSDVYQWFVTLMADLDGVDRQELIRELEGSGSIRLSASKRRRLKTIRGKLGTDSAAVARGIAAALAHPTPHTLEPQLLWTGPESISPPFQTLKAAASHLIESATRRVLIVSYSLSLGANIWEALASLPPQVHIHVIGHDLSQAQRWRHQVEMHFGPTLGRLHLYTFKPESKSDWRKLHAKLLVVDEARSLVGSANFTQLGFHENIEIGVELGPRQSKQLWDLFTTLVTEDILEEHP